MLKDTFTNSGELYIGRNVGEKILNDIESANKSVKIVTPYISSDFVDLLIKKAQSNVEVSLVMSGDFVNEKAKRIEIFKKLIKQIRHTDEKKKRQRKIGLWVVMFSYVVTILFLILCFFVSKHFVYAGLFIPVLIVVHFFLKKIRIYSYTYENLINLSVIMTPYSDPNKFDDSNYLTHAKIFIFDEKLVYLGSMNFTKMGFYKNYESRIRIKDQIVIDAISNEFSYLFSNSNTQYLNLDTLVRSIYEETPN